MPRVTSGTEAHTVVRACNLAFGGDLKRGFLASLGVLGGVITTTRIKRRSSIVRVNPKVKTLARRLTGDTRRIVTLRVSSQLVPILSRALSPCSGIGVIRRSILGTSLGRLVTRGFSNERGVGLITGLPCCVAAPVIVRLLRISISFRAVIIVVRGRITSHLTTRPKAGSCNSLSITIRCRVSTGVTFVIPGAIFVPRPGISSTVVTLGHGSRGPSIPISRPFFGGVIGKVFLRQEGDL